jgi:hypothetical protein
MTGTALLIVSQCSSRLKMHSHLLHKVFTPPHAELRLVQNKVIARALTLAMPSEFYCPLKVWGKTPFTLFSVTSGTFSASQLLNVALIFMATIMQTSTSG